MQFCISLQADNHASNPSLTFFTGRMPFLPPNQQCQSTEGKKIRKNSRILPVFKIRKEFVFTRLNERSFEL